MTQKELEVLSKQLREQKIAHLLLVRMRNGITLSSIADGDDIYDFLQVMIDINPMVMEIMKDVIRKREKPIKTPNDMMYS